MLSVMGLSCLGKRVVVSTTLEVIPETSSSVLPNGSVGEFPYSALMGSLVVLTALSVSIYVASCLNSLS